MAKTKKKQTHTQGEICKRELCAVCTCVRKIYLFGFGKIIGIGSKWPNFITQCHWKWDFSLKFYNPFNSIVKFLSHSLSIFTTLPINSCSVYFVCQHLPTFAMTWCYRFVSKNCQWIQKMPSILRFSSLEHIFMMFPSIMLTIIFHILFVFDFSSVNPAN